MHSCAKGKFDEALDTYRSVTPSDAIKDELDYNLAVAQYRKGDIESAKGMFTEAATSSDSKLASAARYNLGNCFYADAVAAAEKDKPAAIESLGQAIEHYRGSLAGNPNHVDARANIELAAELMKKLQQEQEQQEQQQDQKQDEQKQDQQNQDSESKDGESQQDQQQQDQGQENQEKQDQGSESKDNQSQEQKGEQDQSKSDDQQSGSEDQQSEQQQSQDKSGQSQESEDQSGKEGQAKPEQSAQENASQKPSQDQQQAANDDQTLASSATEEQSQAEANDQPVPSGELKAASEQDESEGSRSRQTLDTIQDGLMSKEEALKMLQAVRDRDMLRRLRQEQLERNMHVPTDKDW